MVIACDEHLCLGPHQILVLQFGQSWFVLRFILYTAVIFYQINEVFYKECLNMFQKRKSSTKWKYRKESDAWSPYYRKPPTHYSINLGFCTLPSLLSTIRPNTFGTLLGFFTLLHFIIGWFQVSRSIWAKIAIMLTLKKRAAEAGSHWRKAHASRLIIFQ